MNYVAYYRVSTKEQGQSGLGLKSQKQAVHRFVEDNEGTLVGEFQDVESGGNINREGLNAAMQMALDTDAMILVNRVDRLTRDGFKVPTMLEDMGIGYIDCESPHDTDMVRNIKLAMAKEEKDKIRKRTKEAQAQIKENIKKNGYHISKAGNRITSLGKVENLGGKKAIEKSKKTRREKAVNHPNNIRATAVIRLMRNMGIPFSSIVEFLNTNEFRTSRGNEFSVPQCRNLFKGYDK